MEKRTAKIHNGLVIEWKLWLPTSPVPRLSLAPTNNINIGTRGTKLAAYYIPDIQDKRLYSRWGGRLGVSYIL